MFHIHLNKVSVSSLQPSQGLRSSQKLLGWSSVSRQAAGEGSGQGSGASVPAAPTPPRSLRRLYCGEGWGGGGGRSCSLPLLGLVSAPLLSFLLLLEQLWAPGRNIRASVFPQPSGVSQTVNGFGEQGPSLLRFHTY